VKGDVYFQILEFENGSRSDGGSESGRRSVIQECELEEFQIMEYENRCQLSSRFAGLERVNEKRLLENSRVWKESARSVQVPKMSVLHGRACFAREGKCRNAQVRYLSVS